MNRSFLLVSLLAGFLFLLPGFSNAALLVQGDVVFDDVNNQYWIQNPDMFDLMTYSQQIEAIAALSGTEYAVYGEWRMATAADIANLYTYTAEEIYTAFEPVLAGNRYYPGNTFIGTGEHYDSRYDESAGDGQHMWTDIYIQLDTEGTITFTKKETTSVADSAVATNVGAWVVVDAASVPVPGAVWLLGAGLIGLAAIRRR